MKKIFLLVFLLHVVLFVTAQNRTATSRDYKTAIGVKLWDGAGLNLKTFIADKSALEFIGFFNRYGTTITGLYEFHGDLNTEGNLKWYLGFGGHANLYKNVSGGGVDGIIGMDFKFSTLPLNLALDWQPNVSFGVASLNGFASRGGFAIRFTL